MFFSIFKSEKIKPVESVETITTLALGIEVKNGKINTEGKIVVEGSFEGDMISGTDVIIGKKGKVVGKIIAKKIILRGSIDGGIDCDEIEVVDGASIRGEIVAKNFIIGNGGIFEGTIKKKC